MIASQVTEAVWKNFADQGWSGLAEVAAPPSNLDPSRTVRRADLLLIRQARRPGMGMFERLVVEVKVSRSDFLSDVRDPEKQARWRTLAHQHAFAVPAGLVSLEEVPRESGLLVVEDTTGITGQPVRIVRWERVAPHFDVREVPAWLFETFIQRASWAEARARGWTAQANGGSPEALRLECDRLRTELHKASNTAVREREARVAWRAIAATATNIPCAWCAQPIVPSRLVKGDYQWKHRDKGADARCAAARELEEQRLVSGRPVPIAPCDDFDPSAVKA